MVESFVKQEIVMVFLVKYVKAVIQIEKKKLKLKNLKDIWKF